MVEDGETTQAPPAEGSTVTSGDKPAAEGPGKERGDRREIKGGLPYSTSPGVLKKALELIIEAERPDKFGGSFMGTVLKLTGGGARAVPPFLKKMQFIGSDGAPTALYSRFKTKSGRSQAAYEGLRHAFSELFRRNEYVHKADENDVKDIIVEITGLRKTDQIVRLIYSSFEAVRSFITSSVVDQNEEIVGDTDANDSSERPRGYEAPTLPHNFGLAYQINIVLPETENISVFNAIFQSLRDNLLR
jgi:hypothetical protein